MSNPFVKKAMLKAMDRTNGELDKAVLAYRENPTDENREHLLRMQEAHVADFYREETEGFIERTK